MMLDRENQERIVRIFEKHMYEKELSDSISRREEKARLEVYNMPHVLYGAQIMWDGKQWCCILGDSTTGVVGLGDTPRKACAEFDRIWFKGR